MTGKVLIVQDEQKLAELLRDYLQQAGFDPSCLANGGEVVPWVRERMPDLILLDLMLPGIMGTEICKMLKNSEKTAHIPIIMLTAKGEEIDRVVGFEIGADDYVIKPFSTRELLLRIKALLRRVSAEKPSGKCISVGPVTIDIEQHQVCVGGEEIVLTTTEFKLLLNLAERIGRVQSRDLLLQNVWGYNYAGDTRTVDTHVTRLRTKLGDAGEMIKTVRGFGYKMEEL